MESGGSLISTVTDSFRLALAQAMASPLLLRGLPLIRFCLHQQHSLAIGIFWSVRRQWLIAAAGSKWLDENVSSEETSKPVLSAKVPPIFLGWDDSEFRKWKNHEDEILTDIEPITLLTKQILHSNRYSDGECLTTEDEKAVVEKLLAYHPHSEDKIGCGLDCIMVDRHPQFRNSRCLFVIRTDGGWIDFSYQKCLRAYIRDKYPTHADRFIREHFKRSS